MVAKCQVISEECRHCGVQQSGGATCTFMSSNYKSHSQLSETWYVLVG